MGPWYPGEDEEEEEPREGSSHAAPTGQVQGGHLARQEESGGAPWHPSDAGGSYDAGTEGGEPALSRSEDIPASVSDLPLVPQRCRWSIAQCHGPADHLRPPQRHMV